MKIEKEFVLREIAGDFILVPVGETAMSFNGLITVNEIGAFLWGKLKEETSIKELTKAILDEYEIDEVTARKDVTEFVNAFIEAGIVK